MFVLEGIEIIRTPYRAPTANAFAERWVRTVPEECVDQLLIIDEAHLRRVLSEYISYYNHRRHRRAHQGIGQQIPVPLTDRQAAALDPVYCRDVLGGIIHDYYRADTHAA